MRRAILIASLFSSICLAAAIFSPLGLLRGIPSSLSAALPLRPDQYQSPMNPGPVQGGAEPESPTGGDAGDNTLSISDILPQTRKINIFASLTRDISSVTGRLESTKPEDNTTLLAPLNSAMQALPRKPWEDRPGDEGVSAQYNEDKAAQNLQRFVEEHVVPLSPWKEGEKIKTLGGQELWWEHNGDGERVIKPGNLVVDGVVGRVGNGEIWAVKGVVNYA
ncbi:FAS1 domain-containing protein [Cladophialophora carrionii]|uniref:FAS1 domain-containing protein n=1 Tax=Cladophialophora carrionii TaxID=86049 RepID=A0A1C1CLR6_9EURO|nr:FAS1 domain-containing protein [Cladophialophora carrionii]